MTKIKICGITNYEDALGACNLGADYLGFNFYPKSPRFVDDKSASDIIKKLSGKAKIVGVFANQSAESIKKTSDCCGLDLIQLSGDESNDFILSLKKKSDKKIIKCFHVRNSDDKLRKKIFIEGNFFDYLMLDSFKKGSYGGTGKSFDLEFAKGIDNKKLFLAGGLNEKNIKQAINKIHPFAVDVCSSIEKYPGKKDFNKMKKFIEAAR